MAAQTFWAATPSGFAMPGGPPNGLYVPPGLSGAGEPNSMNPWLSSMQKYGSLYGGLGGSPTYTGGGGGAFGSGMFNYNANAAGANAAGGGGVPGVAGFPLLQTSKTAAGNTALSNILGQVGGLTADKNQTPFTTINDPAQQTRYTAAGGALDTSTGQQQQSLKDWMTQFLAQSPGAASGTATATGNIANIQGSGPGSLEATLKSIDAAQNQAVQGQTNFALQQVLGGGNRALFGGMNTSDAQNAMANAAASIARQQAVTNAANQRATQQYVTGQRVATAGMPTALAAALGQYQAQPLGMQQQVMGNQLGNVGALGNIGRMNATYMTPLGQVSGALGAMNQYAGGLNALNMFGLGGTFPGSTMPNVPRSGAMPQGGPYGNPNDPYGQFWLGQGAYTPGGNPQGQAGAVDWNAVNQWANQWGGGSGSPQLPVYRDPNLPTGEGNPMGYYYNQDPNRPFGAGAGWDMPTIDVGGLG